MTIRHTVEIPAQFLLYANAIHFAIQPPGYTEEFTLIQLSRL